MSNNLKIEHLENASKSIYEMISELSVQARNYLDNWAKNALLNKTNPKFTDEITRENLEKWNIEIRTYPHDKNKSYYMIQDGKVIDAILEKSNFYEYALNNQITDFSNLHLKYEPIPLDFNGTIITTPIIV